MIARTLGHYQITEKLGEGGMGVVYKARDTHLDRFVAIKMLPPERVADPERKRRFIQEAKADFGVCPAIHGKIQIRPLPPPPWRGLHGAGRAGENSFGHSL